MFRKARRLLKPLGRGHREAAEDGVTRLEMDGLAATLAAGVRRADVEGWVAAYGPWLRGIARAPAPLPPARSEGRPPSLVAKSRERPPAKAWLDAFAGRASRLARGFRIGLLLRAAGVAAAQPIALLES